MKLRHLFAVNAVISVTFGLGFIFAPTPLLALYGVVFDPVGTMVTRLYGAATGGIGLICWFMRPHEASQGARVVVLSLFVADAIGSVVYLDGMLNHVVNALGWSVVGVYAGLTAGYGYFLAQSLRARAGSPQAASVP